MMCEFVAVATCTNSLRNHLIDHCHDPMRKRRHFPDPYVIDFDELPQRDDLVALCHYALNDVWFPLAALFRRLWQ